MSASPPNFPANSRSQPKLPGETNSPRLPSAPIDELADFFGEDIVNEIYMYIFHRRSALLEDVLEAGFDPEAIIPSLTVLAARGLVTQSDNGYWVVVPPSRSLPSLAARLEERARLVRTSLPGLTAAYRAAGTDVEALQLHGVEYLPGAHDVAFAITQVFAQTHTRAKIMRRDSVATRRATFEAMPSLRDGRVGVAERRIECVTVLHTGLVPQLPPEEIDWFESRPREFVLLSGHVPFTAIVGDDGTAVIELARDGNIEGFLVSNPELAQGISETADLVIESATPWNRSGRHEPQSHGLSDTEREILHLLSLGVPDATIARRLGISTRTFDRRLRKILDALGAATRFQAGVMAAQRSWL